MTKDKSRIQSCIDHINTAVDVDPWAVELIEKVFKECGNAISKDKVFDILDYWYDEDSDGYVQACKSINELPPVNPIRPSVIEDIKSEIIKNRDRNIDGNGDIEDFQAGYSIAFNESLAIIDRHTNGIILPS